MERRALGASGIEVTTVGLGTANWAATVDADDAAAQLRAYLDAGGNLIDTARMYGLGRCESMVGELLRSVVDRSELVIATKCALATDPDASHGRPRVDGTRAGMLGHLDESLRALGVDHVDLWQLHAFDARTPWEESMSAVEAALASGRVRAAGLCNHSGWQTGVAAQQLRSRGAALTSTQVEYSLLERGIEREVTGAAAALGMSVLAWAPLGRGVLTGKYRDGVPQERRKSHFFNWYIARFTDSPRAQAVVDEVCGCAAELGVAPLALALAWARDRPGVASALVGARSVDQLSESLQACDFVLPDEVAARLDAVSEPSFGYPERTHF